jgi:cation diffusion facilitator family transporter
MHDTSVQPWKHDHVFLGESHRRNERRTWFVVVLTAGTMIAEIIAGTVFGSMALLADGWHMSTHAAALTISALAYNFARRHAHDPRFSYGTGKFGDLAGFSSALILALVALLIGYESFTRLLSPVTIRFDEATVVAFVGLAVNVVSALLLRGEHHHDHDHADHHEHADHHGHVDHHGHDMNLRAAYMHVLADALTSIMAILALLAGRLFGWAALDPLMGILGAMVIAHWSWSLLKTAGASLLDVVPSRELSQEVRKRLETEGNRVSDIHLWRLGPGHTGVTVALVASDPQPPNSYKERLADIKGLSHVTVEVHPCEGKISVAPGIR